MPQKPPAKSLDARRPKPICAFCMNKTRKFLIVGLTAWICDICVCAYALLIQGEYDARQKECN